MPSQRQRSRPSPPPPPPSSAIFISSISPPTFERHLRLYDRVRDRVAQAKKKSSPLDLTELDHARYTLIPSAIAARRGVLPSSLSPSLTKDDDDDVVDVSDKKTSSTRTTTAEVPPQGSPPYLTKPELVTLMDWKLTHGTFRPSLRGLIAQNAPEAVERTTREGLALWPDVKASVKKLSELRGVGPATASLILSVGEPDEAPFFSDEVFCWATAEEDMGGVDWRRKIKYSVAEYLEVVEAVGRMRSRLVGGGEDGLGKEGAGKDGRVSAVQCEKVAYVLGNGGDPEEAVEDDGTGQDDAGVTASPESLPEDSSKDDPAAAGSKRKRKDTTKTTSNLQEPTTSTRSKPTRSNPTRTKRPRR